MYVIYPFLLSSHVFYPLSASTCLFIWFVSANCPEDRDRQISKFLSSISYLVSFRMQFASNFCIWHIENIFLIRLRCIFENVKNVKSISLLRQSILPKAASNSSFPSSFNIFQQNEALKTKFDSFYRIKKCTK